MKFGSKTGLIKSLRSACLVAAVYEEGELSASAQALDEAADGLIGKLVKSGDIKGKIGQTLMLPQPAGLACDRLLLVGAGKNEKLDERRYLKVIQAMLGALKKSAAKDALCTLTELPVKDRDHAWKIHRCIEKAGNSFYRFEQMKSKEAQKQSEPDALKTLNFHIAGRGAKEQAAQAISEGQALVAGMDLTRDLANLPGNVCTPTYLAKEARALGRKYKSIKTSVLEEKEMKELGMGALLAVSRGSRQPAKLIVMEYNGAKTAKGKKEPKPVVLVGKGLTFDAGGISLKPGAHMDEMKYDMCGGASVFGTLKAIAEMALPINVVGVVPSSENLPDGDANKPGDILTSMSGQTIEVLNTDAEGRLILCDALTYSQRFDPELVVDIATLTGACVIALGHHATGLLVNDEELADELLAAGKNSHDRAWQLPLWEEYDEQLKSPFADMANIGGRDGGTITAACFLSRYTRDYRWAHLDIAGTAWTSGGKKGATGRPVPLLTQFLIDRAQAK